MFKTSDFPLAIALSASGFALELIDISNPQRCDFCFSDTEKLKLFVDDFWKGSTKVEPRTFYIHLKLLKTRLKAQL